MTSRILNHVAITATSSGTTSSVSPSSGSVSAGTLFTPTAGRLLVCVVGSTTTSTTPNGWTLPTDGAAVAAAGLYVFYKTAAGNDSLTTTHGQSNIPVAFHFMEFDSDSTFVDTASATAVSWNAGNGPSFSTNTTIQAFGAACQDAPDAPGSGTWAFNGTGTFPVTELSDIQLSSGPLFSMCEVSDFTNSTGSYLQYTANGGSDLERLVFEINAPSTYAAPASELWHSDGNDFTQMESRKILYSNGSEWSQHYLYVSNGEEWTRVT